MSLYLPSMSDSELLRYAEQSATTAVEEELVQRYHRLHDNAEAIEYVSEFKQVVWDQADALANVIGYNRTKASNLLFDAIQKFEGAQR